MFVLDASTLATAPKGERCVTGSDHGNLTFYSTVAGTKLGELPTGAGAHTIAFSTDGRTAYVSNQTAGTVGDIDIATRAVTKAIGVDITQRHGARTPVKSANVGEVLTRSTIASPGDLATPVGCGGADDMDGSAPTRTPREFSTMGS